jgi:hypothetical protein
MQGDSDNGGDTFNLSENALESIWDLGPKLLEHKSGLR